MRLLPFKIAKFFPPPVFLSMPAAGIDISDSMIKYLDAECAPSGYIPRVSDSIQLSPGIVEGGTIKDKVALAEVLRVLRNKHRRAFAYAALPEELAYIYTLVLPCSMSHKEKRQAIEFSLAEYVPLTIEQVSFDFDIAERNGNECIVSVTVFPIDVVENYKAALEMGGFIVKALELEAYAVARAVVPKTDTGVSMVVDFGRTRTGITVTLNRVPIYSVTVKIGGSSLTESIMNKLKLSVEEADALKREEGFGIKNEDVRADVLKGVNNLVEKIKEHNEFYNKRMDSVERRDENTKMLEMRKIKKIFLCGGSIGLKGLEEYLSSALGMPVFVGDVWQNLFDINEHIPTMNKNESLQFATSAGLLLRDMEI